MPTRIKFFLICLLSFGLSGCDDDTQGNLYHELVGPKTRTIIFIVIIVAAIIIKILDWSYKKKKQKPPSDDETPPAPPQ